MSAYALSFSSFFLVMFNFLYNKLPPYFPFFLAFSLFIRSSLVHITQPISDTQVHTSLSVLCSIFRFNFFFCPFLSQLAFHGLVLHVIVSISLSWPCPACNNNSHSSLICDSFQFLLTIHLCLSSLHAFHSIHPCPSCSLNYLCCVIHPCHFTLSALDPVCCCITATLSSALFFIHDCHSMDTFPIPHAPPCSPPHSSCLIHITSCRFMLVASFFMPSFKFTYTTCPIYATHFTNVCHSSHTFYQCFMLLTHLPTFQSFSFFACHFELHR